jgi:hypothetical protein
MKKFLILIICAGLFLVPRINQTGSGNRFFLPHDTDSIKWQIDTLENNLFPPVCTEGENKVYCSLFIRMEMYPVHILSVKSIDEKKTVAKGRDRWQATDNGFSVGYSVHKDP